MAQAKTKQSQAFGYQPCVFYDYHFVFGGNFGQAALKNKK